MKLAICGKMCSGKSTLAKMICEIDSRYKIYSFGKKVKHVASDLFDMDPLHKDRTLLTSIGTKMRDIDPDVWVNYVIKNSRSNSLYYRHLRYQNEYDALVKHGWSVIQLLIRLEVQEYRLRLFYPDTFEDHLRNREHESEKSQFNWHTNHFPRLVFHDSNSIDYVNDVIRSYIQKNDPSFVKKQPVSKDES